jgi:hypothetical protein
VRACLRWLVNDFHSTTKADILALYDRAIDLALPEEALVAGDITALAFKGEQ